MGSLLEGKRSHDLLHPSSCHQLIPQLGNTVCSHASCNDAQGDAAGFPFAFSFLNALLLLKGSFPQTNSLFTKPQTPLSPRGGWLLPGGSSEMCAPDPGLTVSLPDSTSPK